MPDSEKMSEPTGAPVIPANPEPVFSETPVMAAATIEPPKKQKPSQLFDNMEPNTLRTLRKWIGIFCVAVAVLSVIAGVAFYVNSGLPDWAYPSEGSMSRQYIADLVADIAENEQIVADPNAQQEEVYAAKNGIAADKSMIENAHAKAMESFVMRTGAPLSILLFIFWLYLAMKSRKRGFNAPIARFVILYVVGGFLFFSFVPSMAVNIVENITTVLLTVVFLIVVGYIIMRAFSKVGSGGSSAGAGSGGLSGSSSGGSHGGGGGGGAAGGSSGSVSAYAAAPPQKEKYVHQKKVGEDLRLSRRSDSWNGPHIAYYGHDGEWHYVCTQEEYDKGRVEIVDKKGTKRKI